MKNDKSVRYSLLMLFASALWGLGFVSQYLGAQYVGPFTFLATRSWIAVAVLLPLVYPRLKKALRNVKENESTQVTKPSGKPGGFVSAHPFLCGSMFCGFFIFSASWAQQAGIAYTTAGKAGFITTLYVVLVPVFSIFTGSKTNPRIWICVALAVAGLYLLSINEGFAFSRGDAMMVLCAFLFSIQIMGISYFVENVGSILLSWGQLFFEAVFATVCVLFFEHPTAENLRLAAMAILYAGVFSSGVAFTIQALVQKRLNATVASLIMCMESVFSALFGWIFLNQGMSLRELVGAALMLLAILLSQLII